MALNTINFTQMFKAWFPNTPVNGDNPTPAKCMNCFIVLDGDWYIHTSSGWATFTPALVTGGVE